MNTFTRMTALAGASALIAAPLTFALAAPANADVDRQGSCGTTANYEFSVDREGNGWEIDAGLDNVAPRSTWKFVIRQDGQQFLKMKRTADYEGDVDVDAFRHNTAGNDKFTFKAKRVGGTVKCGTSITVA